MVLCLQQTHELLLKVSCVCVMSPITITVSHRLPSSIPSINFNGAERRSSRCSVYVLLDDKLSSTTLLPARVLNSILKIHHLLFLRWLYYFNNYCLFIHGILYFSTALGTFHFCLCSRTGTTKFMPTTATKSKKFHSRSIPPFPLTEILIYLILLVIIQDPSTP